MGFLGYLAGGEALVAAIAILILRWQRNQARSDAGRALDAEDLAKRLETKAEDEKAQEVAGRAADKSAFARELATRDVLLKARDLAIERMVKAHPELAVERANAVGDPNGTAT